MTGIHILYVFMMQLCMYSCVYMYVCMHCISVKVLKFALQLAFSQIEILLLGKSCMQIRALLLVVRIDNENMYLLVVTDNSSTYQTH